MDDPLLDATEHAAALRGLERLNLISGSAQIIWEQILSVARSSRAPSVSILDIATGSGDIPIALAKKAAKAQVKLVIAGCDVSATAVRLATEKAAKAGVDIDFFAHNILEGKLPRMYDVVMTSLFTHHLDPPEVIRLLMNMRDHAAKMVMVNDLERSGLSYCSVWIATRVLTTSKVVRFDGPVSVQAAYTMREFSEMAKHAGLSNATVARKFPCRLLLTSKSGQ